MRVGVNLTPLPLNMTSIVFKMRHLSNRRIIKLKKADIILINYKRIWYAFFVCHFFNVMCELLCVVSGGGCGVDV